MLRLSNKWFPYLTSQPETGMGYQIAAVRLKDGRQFPKTVIDLGYITRIGDDTVIPFEEDEIESIVVTPDVRPW